MAVDMLLLVAFLSSLMAGAAMIISLLIMRNVVSLREETARMGRTLRYERAESDRMRLVRSAELSEESLKNLSRQTRELSAESSKVFAGVARLLNETHRLEGNPRPNIDTQKLREINESLLSIGESSLSATRIAEKLSGEFSELDSGIRKLKKAARGSDDAS